MPALNHPDETPEQRAERLAEAKNWFMHGSPTPKSNAQLAREKAAREAARRSAAGLAEHRAASRVGTPCPMPERVRSCPDCRPTAGLRFCCPTNGKCRSHR